MGGGDEVQGLVVACEHVDEREPPVVVLLLELKVLAVEARVRTRPNLPDILDGNLREEATGNGQHARGGRHTH